MVAEHKDVLMVPNPALRFVPRPEQVAAAFRQRPKREHGSHDGDHTRPPGEEAKPETARGTLWLPQDDQVRPLRVKVGLTDGTMTEVASPDLQAGMPVVVSEVEKGEEPAGTAASPFTPQIFKGRH
jgi:HlyD family secretion protein